MYVVSQRKNGHFSQAQQLQIKYNASRYQASDVLNLLNVTLPEDQHHIELPDQQQVTITSNVTVNLVRLKIIARHVNVY